MNEAFFTVHRDLDREGPGEAADVLWALDVAATPKTGARLCDLGCGPGADVVTLAEARNDAEVHGIDQMEHFIEAAKKRTERFGDRVTLETGDFMAFDGRDYDLVWCAGAAYFAGFIPFLDHWGKRLRPGGAIAFSEPSWMIDPPSDAARAFWDGEYVVKTREQIEAELHAAGWGIVGQRWIVDQPWAAYYGPMIARLDALEDASPEAPLAEAIAQSRDEIAKWQAAREEIAYSLFVVRPS